MIFQLKNRVVQILMLLLLVIPSHSFGAIILTLNESSQPAVSGYKVYHGISTGNYQESVDIGKAGSYTLPASFFDNNKHYFAVTAYDIAGNESDYSIETIEYLPDPSLDSDNDGVKDITEIFYNKTDPKNPTDNLPAADAGSDQPVIVNPGEVALSGVASDPNNDALVYNWSQDAADNITVELTSSNTLDTSFLAIEDGGYNFIFRVTDTNMAGAEDRIQIIVNNIAPDSNAGVDQAINVGDEITLYGSATDANNDSLTYQWSIDSGPGIILPEILSTTAQAAFIAYKPGTYSLSFTAIDDNGVKSEPDFLTITASILPTAIAGDDTRVFAGFETILDGLASIDPDTPSAGLNYAWALTNYYDFTSEDFTLTDISAAQAVFTPYTPGSYIFSLTVSNTSRTSLPDFITITVDEPPYFVPISDAGADQHVVSTEKVFLGGGKSYSYNNEPLSFLWVQTGGTWVALSDPLSMAPYFVVSQAGTYSFELVVSDAVSKSLSDTVVVNVEGSNHIPLADAGGDDIRVSTGETVYLDAGNSSDPDGDTLKYFWTQAGGASLILSDPQGVRPYFVPEISDIYQFELKVYDGSLYSVADSIIIVADSINMRPVADPGENLIVETGSQVILSAEKSFDPDNDSLNFTWLQSSGAHVVLNGENDTLADFTPLSEGKYSFVLLANDGSISSTPETIEVYVSDRIEITGLIDENGGAVSASLADFQIELSIPALALTNASQVSIGESYMSSPFSGDIQMLGSVINLQPLETRFAIPASIKITAVSADIMSRLIVKHYNPSLRIWEEAQLVEHTPTQLIVEIDSLEKAAVGVRSDTTSGSTKADDTTSMGSGAGGCGFIKPGGGGSGPSDASFMMALALAAMIPLLRGKRRKTSWGKTF